MIFFYYSCYSVILNVFKLINRCYSIITAVTQLLYRCYSVIIDVIQLHVLHRPIENNLYKVYVDIMRGAIEAWLLRKI